MAVGLKLPLGYQALSQAIKNDKLGWPERTTTFNALIVSDDPAALDAAFAYAETVLTSTYSKARAEHGALINV